MSIPPVAAGARPGRRGVPRCAMGGERAPVTPTSHGIALPTGDVEPVRSALPIAA